MPDDPAPAAAPADAALGWLKHRLEAGWDPYDRLPLYHDTPVKVRLGRPRTLPPSMRIQPYKTWIDKVELGAVFSPSRLGHTVLWVYYGPAAQRAILPPGWVRNADGTCASRATEDAEWAEREADRLCPVAEVPVATIEGLAAVHDTSELTWQDVAQALAAEVQA